MNHADTGAAAEAEPLSHLEQAGETYFQHMRCAFSFAGRMIWGGLCVLLHGVFPNVLCRKGSTCIEQLHDDMIRHRKQYGEARALRFTP